MSLAWVRLAGGLLLSVALYGVAAASIGVLFSWAADWAIEERLAGSSRAAVSDVLADLADMGRRMNMHAEMVADIADIADAIDGRDEPLLRRLMVEELSRLKRTDPTVTTLEVTDAKGVVLMRGHRPDMRGDDKSAMPQIAAALTGRATGGLTISPTSGEAASDGLRPIRRAGTVVGTVKVGTYFAAGAIAELKARRNIDVVFMFDGKLRASTFGAGTVIDVPPEIYLAASVRQTVWPIARIGDNRYRAAFLPLGTDVGRNLVIGFFIDRASGEQRLHDFQQLLVKIAATGAIVVVPLIAMGGRRRRGVWLTVRGC